MSVPTAVPRVVIIGAGVAGASAARRVRDLLGDCVEIIVLEAAGHVGGRARRIPFAGTMIEVGGTLLHSSNRLLAAALAESGLGVVGSDDVELRGIIPGLGVWTGAAFALEATGGSDSVNVALLARYGGQPLQQLVALVSETLAGFESLYARLERGERFTSPAQLIAAAGLGRFIESSLAELLFEAGVSRQLIDELCTGIVRNMYNQDSRMLALPGIVGLIGAGLAGGSLYGVDGGNDRLVASMLDRARAIVRLDAKAESIGFDRSVAVAGADTLSADAVIVATPLTDSGIRFDPPLAVPHIPYQHVHVTLAAGRPAPQYFGHEPVPSGIFTTTDCGAFSSLGVSGRASDSHTAVLKFFSVERIEDAELGAMIADLEESERLEWAAFPVMGLEPENCPFEIAPAVFFANALEPFVSTLETEAIAGRIVADLAVDRIRG